MFYKKLNSDIFIATVLLQGVGKEAEWNWFCVAFRRHIGILASLFSFSKYSEHGSSAWLILSGICFIF